jgi:hypothetical protein
MKATPEIARAWSEALRTELEQWPGVRVTRSFGMIMVYRGEQIIAALPGTRMIYAENAILLKFQQVKPALAQRMAADPRFGADFFASGKPDRDGRKGEGRKWRIFLLRGDADVHGAIEWLAEAYKAAGKRRKQ